MKIKVTKLMELPDARHPNNIQVGHESVGFLPESFFRPPTVGERFDSGSLSTSVVTEIIDENTFKTLNSIYRWEILQDDVELSCTVSPDIERALHARFVLEFCGSDGRLKPCNPDAIFNWFASNMWRNKK